MGFIYDFLGELALRPCFFPGPEIYTHEPLPGHILQPTALSKKLVMVFQSWRATALTSSIPSLKKKICLLSTYYVPVIILGMEDTEIKVMDKIFVLLGLAFYGRTQTIGRQANKQEAISGRDGCNTENRVVH